MLGISKYNMFCILSRFIEVKYYGKLSSILSIHVSILFKVLASKVAEKSYYIDTRACIYKYYLINISIFATFYLFLNLILCDFSISYGYCKFILNCKYYPGYYLFDVSITLFFFICLLLSYFYNYTTI